MSVTLPSSAPSLPSLTSLEERSHWLAKKALLYANNLHKSDLNQDIRSLWQVLTQERASGLGDYFQKAPLRRAYIGYYLPIYAHKTAAILLQLIKEGHIKPSTTPISLLDLGAGPLVGAFGVYLALGQVGHVSAIDQHGAALKTGAKLFQDWLGDSSKQTFIETTQANLLGPMNYLKNGQKFDLILLSNVINEIGRSDRYLENQLILLKKLARFLTPNGRILVIEPANRLSTRPLMRLRDEIFADSELSILAPCTGAESCPLLQDSYSWCHAELNWSLPPSTLALNQQIGFNKERLQLSYLLLAKNPKLDPHPPTLRIVSGEMTHNNWSRRYICTPDGLLTLKEKIPAPKLKSVLRGEQVLQSEMDSCGIIVEKEGEMSGTRRVQNRRAVRTEAEKGQGKRSGR